MSDPELYEGLVADDPACIECGHAAHLHGVLLGAPPERSSGCHWRSDPWGSELDDGCECQAYEAPFR